MEIRNPKSEVRNQSVAILGGGLAGLAAAARLCESGLRVELFEARSRLGGRAGSFYDQAAEEWVDYCQHVGMACCTNLADFCRRTGIAHHFRRHSTLHFFGLDGKRCDLRGSRWLPAPLHLASSLLRLKYLSLMERFGIARTLLRLARTPALDTENSPTIGEWLQEQGQSHRAIELFWGVVLVSALGETLNRASLAAARKVFVDGFMANRAGYQVDIPQAPLIEIFGNQVGEWLRERGVSVHLGCGSVKLSGDAATIHALELADGSRPSFGFYVTAVPWHRVAEILPDVVSEAIPDLSGVPRIESSPITGLHLWFDRPITDLPHAVLVGRLSQWLFNRESSSPNSGTNSPRGHYYQVVISASRDLSQRSREDVLAEVLADLHAIWPDARQAKLLRWRMVTDRDAVFSARPGLDGLRPAQRTPIPNLFLAGDWTRTGWPATLESAVRSGYLAAEGILQSLGRESRLLVPDLPRGWLAKWLIRE